MPRIALLSDIHGNLSALKNVIKKLKLERPDIWLCLGDLVGYGPFSSECIKLVRAMDMICVKGNHDAGVTGELTLRHFRNPNRSLIELIQKELTEEELLWLKNLSYKVENDNWMAVHASPHNPEQWEYVESAFKGRALLKDIDVDFCFLGHTHRSAIISNQLGINKLKKGNRYIINPGSVGQSRDGDYRASCALIDTDTYELTIFRIDFNQEENLSALMKKGFSRKDAHQLLQY